MADAPERVLDHERLDLELTGVVDMRIRASAAQWIGINRTPVDGLVTRVEYRPGTFLPAYKAEASGNELNEIWLDHHGETVVVRQIVGILARRIVCRVVEGQSLERGQRIGLMKFGSRMDVFLPRHVEIAVTVGQMAVAGETGLARLQPHAGRPSAVANLS